MIVGKSQLALKLLIVLLLMIALGLIVRPISSRAGDGTTAGEKDDARARWHLPPTKTPMIWEGRTPGEICRQIKDPKQNNGKTIAQIIEHVTADKLVLWGWNPGDGRTLPPMAHDEFAKRFQDWARLGAACPQ